MTLMPGLITSHLHADFYKFDINDSDRLGKERPPGVMMAIGVRTCRVLLESGFTGYSGASCSNDVDANSRWPSRRISSRVPGFGPGGHHLAPQAT